MTANPETREEVVRVGVPEELGSLGQAASQSRCIAPLDVAVGNRNLASKFILFSSLFKQFQSVSRS